MNEVIKLLTRDIGIGDKMREILFKGKRKDNGEWVYGYYCKYGYSGKEKHYIIPSYASDLYAIEVIPETVGQFTNKNDKNDKKIFEGDIVKFKRTVLGDTIHAIGTVYYYDKLPIFYILATTGDAREWVYCEEIEVIGNIHDNPELLKGEKNE